MARRRLVTLRNVRRVSQIAFLAGTVALIIATRIQVAEHLPGMIPPRSSPLLAITTMAASRRLTAAFWPAAVLLAATAVLGRFFCGWICPLGTLIDISDRLIAWARRRRDTGSATRAPKYILLGALLVLAGLGAQAAGWFDPTSLFVLSFSIFIHPSLVFLAGGLFDTLYHTPARGASLAVENALRHSVLATSTMDRPAFVYGGVVGLALVGILLLGLRGRRIWCRSICPLGALYALAGRRPVLRLVRDGSCTQCGACSRVCKMGAISADGASVVAGECIRCGTCTAECPTGALRYEWRAGKAEGRDEPVPARRAVLGSIAAGLVALPILRLAGGRSRGDGRTIRPPGAAEPSRFLQLCVRCGACMKVCPQNALQPCLTEAGLEGLMTPRVVPRIGYCEYNCTLCGQVCPTGAISELSEEEKHRWVIGKAYIDKNRCIAWARGKECSVCQEVCPIPTKAIDFEEHEVRRRWGREVIKQPYVIPDLCIGCGACENKCPVEGEAAIRVVGARGHTAGRGERNRNRHLGGG